MNISDVLSPDAILTNLECPNKKHAFHEIACLGEAILKQKNSQIENNTQNENNQNNIQIKKATIFKEFWNREIIGSTALENGTAIPRAKIDNIDNTYAIFAKLNKPITFNETDDTSVDIIFALITQKNYTTGQRRLLAKISRLISNQTTVDKLRKTQNVEKIYAILTENSDRDRN